MLARAVLGSGEDQGSHQLRPLRRDPLSDGSSSRVALDYRRFPPEVLDGPEAMIGVLFSGKARGIG